MSVVRDPENKEELFSEISQVRNSTQIYNLVNKWFPDWIVEECPSYSPFYKQYEDNWEKVANATRQPKRRILIVNEIIFDDPMNEYTGIRACSEILTRCGFCVRRTTEFKKCTVCKLAIKLDDECPCLAS